MTCLAVVGAVAIVEHVVLGYLVLEALQEEAEENRERVRCDD